MTRKNKKLEKKLTECRHNKASSLDLSDCGLTKIPKQLGEFTWLEKIDIMINQITDLSPLKYLLGLRSFHSANNPIKNPPREVVDAGIEQIRQHFNALEKHGSEALREIKVLLLGKPGAGKTTLCKRLMGETDFEKLSQDESTPGVDVNIHRFPVRNTHYRINFWDFAGQETTYSHHELFFSNRAVYLIVLNGREADKPFDWLETVKVLTPEQGNECKVFLVRTQLDSKGFDKNPTLTIEALKEKYPFIAGEKIFNLSSITGEGFDDFEKQLMKLIINHPQANEKYPSDRIAIKKKNRSAYFPGQKIY